MGFTSRVGLAATLQPLLDRNHHRTVTETEHLRRHWNGHLPLLTPNQFPESIALFEGPNCYAFAIGLLGYGFIRPGDVAVRRRGATSRRHPRECPATPEEAAHVASALRA